MGKYDTLNKEQKEAVYHTEGPLLILAGAGSGKTRVLTHRIAYLIEEKKVNPWNIMAITFTNKAAKEMRERVDNLVGIRAQDVWVSTFHSSCVKILRRHIDKMNSGFDRYFTIYDTEDSKKIIKECIKQLNLDPKQYKESSILSVINSAKNDCIPPSLYVKQSAGDYRKEIYGKIYNLYDEKLRKNNALDFGDLLFKTVELFEIREDVLREYQQKFKYIMVDEYQDTNGVQFTLISQLAKEHQNLCVVGDDDQSIYKFRGADITNILNFEKIFKNTKVIKLEQNYRSTKTILEAANQVIRNNFGRKEKRLWTQNETGEKIVFRCLQNEHDEAKFIADTIIEGIEEEGRDYKDYALLYRTNAQSRVIEDRFIKDNIPYKIFGGISFYQRREIKDLLAYLKIINNTTDDLAVKRIINVPRRGIGNATIEKVESYAYDNNLSFFDALKESSNIPNLTRANKKIKDFVVMINLFKDILETDSLVKLIEEILKITGYKKELELEGTQESLDRLDNIGELISKIAEYEQNSENPTLNGFLEEVSLVADIDQYEENSNVVVLMTLHSAKGLEFPYVFMTGLEDGLFPSYLSISTGNEEDLEEERRLCYVGITRAKKQLYITSAKSRMVNGTTQYNTISRFVSEISENLLDMDLDVLDIGKKPIKSYKDSASTIRSVPYNLTENKKIIPSSKNKKLDYGEGDLVKHKKFGIGQVIKVEPGGADFNVTVKFPSVGVKKLLAGLSGLKKY